MSGKKKDVIDGLDFSVLNDGGSSFLDTPNGFGSVINSIEDLDKLDDEDVNVDESGDDEDTDDNSGEDVKKGDEGKPIDKKDKDTKDNKDGDNSGNDDDVADDSQEVLIDGVKCKLNKDGDAVDDDGKIVAKKEELEEVNDDGSVSGKAKSAFRVFAELQREKGIIDFKDEEYEETDDFLISKVEETINSEIEKYKSSLHPKVKEIIDLYEDGVPLNTLIEYKASIEDFESIKEEDISNSEPLQKDLVREFLSLTGLSKEKIDAKISRFETNGILEDEAKEALSEIIKLKKKEEATFIESKKKETKQKVDNFNNWITTIKTTIDKTDEIIPGIKMSKKDKDILYNSITKFDKDNKNEIVKSREKDPMFDLRVAFLDQILKWDFSVFETKSKTKAAKSLKDSLNESDKFAGRTFRRKTSDDNGSEGGKIDYGVIKRALKKNSVSSW